MKKLNISGISLLICISLFNLSCAVNPVTGKKELMLYSHKGEVALGAKVHQQISMQYGLYDNPQLTSYIRSVGMKLTPFSHRPELKYHFHILDTPVVNAFAAPGGYIYVTRGILTMINSEAELAVILGHELGHVNARHSVRKMSGLMILNLGLAIGSALDKKIAKYSGLASAGIQLLFLKFSRDNEFQADSLGIEYSRQGGYNPGKMISFFNSLSAMGDLSNKTSLPGFLSTHPLTKNRIKKVKESLNQQDNRRKTNKNVYFNSINNMIFGENTRQGFTKNNQFYHPSGKFTFTFPSNWNLRNTPRQVILSDLKGKAAIVLQVEKSNQDLTSYLTNKTSQFNLISKPQIYKHNINGLKSMNSLCNVSTEDSGNLKYFINCIRMGSDIYTFFSATSSTDFNYFKQDIVNTFLSFSSLKNKRILNTRSRRLKIIRADGKTKLSKYFQKARINRSAYKYFAMLNKLNLDSVPRRNTLLKVTR